MRLQNKHIIIKRHTYCSLTTTSAYIYNGVAPSSERGHTAPTLIANRTYVLRGDRRQRQSISSLKYLLRSTSKYFLSSDQQINAKYHHFISVNTLQNIGSKGTCHKSLYILRMDFIIFSSHQIPSPDISTFPRNVAPPSLGPHSETLHTLVIIVDI